MRNDYYTSRTPELLKAFDEESLSWRPVIACNYGVDFEIAVWIDARRDFEALLSCIPYIGGDENHLTGSLVGSVRYLALYQAMKKHGRTAEETGKILYDAILRQSDEPPEVILPSAFLTRDRLMERRKIRAERSQERRYPGDYVYEFAPGDGVEFDYGYDFLECAAEKFYHAQDADEFTPFYCYLDFPKSMMGLTRMMTLAEGHPKCNHRFKEGRKAEFDWPPPFVKR